MTFVQFCDHNSWGLFAAYVLTLIAALLGWFAYLQAKY